MWTWPRPTSLPNGTLVHPAVLPQQTWAENWGLCLLGELGLYLTQCGLGRGRGLPPYEVALWSTQPFGYNTPTSQTRQADNGSIATSDSNHCTTPSRCATVRVNVTTARHAASCRMKWTVVARWETVRGPVAVLSRTHNVRRPVVTCLGAAAQRATIATAPSNQSATAVSNMPPSVISALCRLREILL